MTVRPEPPAVSRILARPQTPAGSGAGVEQSRGRTGAGVLRQRGDEPGPDMAGGEPHPSIDPLGARIAGDAVPPPFMDGAPLETPVFSVADRTYRWAEVVLSMHLSGGWGPFEAGVRAALRRAPANPQELERAAEKHRYRHRLLSADDLFAWLEHRGIALDEWRASVCRSLGSDGDGAEARTTAPPDVSALERALWVDGICHGIFADAAGGLAEAAAASAWGAAHDTGAPPIGTTDPLARVPQDLLNRGLPGLPPAILPRTAESIAATLAEAERAIDLALTGDALQAEVVSHEVEWIRVEGRSGVFATEDAAREAVLYVTEDGVPLDDAVREAGATIEQVSRFLEDVREDVRPALLSASPGDVVGPQEGGGRWYVVLVEDRRPPSLADPPVEERARLAAKRRFLERESAWRVRWRERV